MPLFSPPLTVYPPTGKTLWDHAHGIDRRAVQAPTVRKSIGCDVNWGVRPDSPSDVSHLIRQVSEQVAARLREAGDLSCRTITLKIKRRQKNAPEPGKFLGHGICDTITRSVTVARFVRSADAIHEAAWKVHVALEIPPTEVRGVGITVTRLSSDADAVKRGGRGAGV